MKKLMWAVTALMVTLVAGCATTMYTQETNGTQVMTLERECAEGETPPCFDFREGPAGGTATKRSTWCQDHAGLCTGAFFAGVALVAGGTAAIICASTDNCRAEGGQGATVNMNGGR